MQMLVSLIAIVLSGCAATGPVFTPVAPPDPDSAVVYIYRERTFAFGARAAYFYVNDVNVFDLNADGYSWLTLPAGRYKLRQTWALDIIPKPIEANVELKAGEIRYLSLSTGVCRGGYRLHEVCVERELRNQPPQVGRAAIADKHFQENFGMAKLKRQLGTQ